MGCAMKRIRLTIAYDGTDYCGWQIQKNAVTVQGELEKALCRLLGRATEVAGASRTDSGVHAMGNVAVFDTDTRIPPEKIAMALNHFLPEDIRIQESQQVADDFHPRYCESVKTYEYTILNTRVGIPVRNRYSLHVCRPLDVCAMQEAAEVLVGTHDFSAFCSAGSQVKSKVRTILEASVAERDAMAGREIVIRVSGNGFLYNMVRIIAGTLMEVGQARRTAASVEEAVRSGERGKAGPTAPAHGLMLMEIRY